MAAGSDRPHEVDFDDQEVTWVDVADCASPGLTIARRGRIGRRTRDDSGDLPRVHLARCARSEHRNRDCEGRFARLARLRYDQRFGRVPLPRLRRSLSGQARISVRARHEGPERRSGMGHSLDRAAAIRPARPGHLRSDGRSLPGAERRGAAGVPSAGRGTVSGVTAAIESGAISARGQRPLDHAAHCNPDGWFAGTDGRPCSRATGYWPINPRATEPGGAGSRHRRAHRGGPRPDPRLLRRRPQPGPRTAPVRHGAPRRRLVQSPRRFVHLRDRTCDWTNHIIDCWFVPYLRTWTGETRPSPINCRATSSGGSTVSTATASGSTRSR